MQSGEVHTLSTRACKKTTANTTEHHGNCRRCGRDVGERRQSAAVEKLSQTGRDRTFRDEPECQVALFGNTSILCSMILCSMARTEGTTRSSSVIRGVAGMVINNSGLCSATLQFSAPWRGPKEQQGVRV